VSLDRPQRYYTRTDLFLVRIWSVGPDATGSAGTLAGSDGEVDGTGTPEWRGQVHRAGDEEAHNFNSWQDLTVLLLAMISINKRR
jgi:hypothetical protein